MEIFVTGSLCWTKHLRTGSSDTCHMLRPIVRISSNFNFPCFPSYTCSSISTWNACSSSLVFTLLVVDDAIFSQQILCDKRHFPMFDEINGVFSFLPLGFHNLWFFLFGDCNHWCLLILISCGTQISFLSYVKKSKYLWLILIKGYS